MNLNFTQHESPTNDQLRAQLVSMMNQLGIPVPPKPDISQFRAYGPDTVHEMIHTVQANNMADSIQLLAAKLTEASNALKTLRADVLTRAPEAGIDDHAELREQIETTLNTVSANSLTVAKTVLDLQDIEDELREAKAPAIGGYL